MVPQPHASLEAACLVVSQVSGIGLLGGAEESTTAQAKAVAGLQSNAIITDESFYSWCIKTTET